MHNESIHRYRIPSYRVTEIASLKRGDNSVTGSARLY
jgi:hypothetical protein